MSNFHVLLPVRDEADVIGECLAHLLRWADSLYVFDTGSVDATWEIVQQVAASDNRVKPLRKDPVFFTETKLRGWLFNHARQHMRDGDWFLRVDADEFHHITPPEFVKTRMRKHETCAYHQYYNFCLLESEVANWGANHDSASGDSRPISDERRWYKLSVYSEPRLCRYRATMQWPPTVSFPFNAGFIARERLPIRHYPHRSPAQLERRCRLRAAMVADDEISRSWTSPGMHWYEREWRKFVTPDSDSELKYWQPGTELPEVRLTNHLAKPRVRLLQRLAHQFLLPVLDRRRPSWPTDTYPQQIPAEVVARLQSELSTLTQ